jgi:hypothetical protein
MLNEQINKLNQDVLDNPELYDRKVWAETRMNPKEIVYTCRDPRCKAEPTEGDRHEESCIVAQGILEKGTCPECGGFNLNEDLTKCFDCSASDYE